MGKGSDVDALARGFRARVLVLALLALGGLAAALWSGTRDRGRGAPESRQRLMVVAGEADIDDFAVLERAGFEIEVASFEVWTEAARDALGESEAEGLALLLELADVEGVGYLVLEGPGAFDLGAELDGLEVEPAPADISDLDARDYAVLSVGDLAFPHDLSVDEVGDHELIELPGFAALEAVFSQPSLLAREDDERPTIEELQLEHALEPGVRMVARPARFAAAIATAEAAVAAQLAVDEGVQTLAPPRSAGSAVALANGEVLVVHHPLEVSSRDATRLELRPGPRMRLDYLDRAGLDARLRGGALVLAPCVSLAGGSIELERQPRIEAAVDGSALLVSDLEQTRLWWLDEGPRCSWRSWGSLDGVGDGRLYVAPARRTDGVDGPRAGLVAAEVGVGLDGRARVGVWSDGAGRGAVELLELDEGRFRSAAFVDADHLVLSSSAPLSAERATTTRTREDALHFVDYRAPGAQLRVPTAFFAEGAAVLELAVVEPARSSAGPDPGPRVVIAAARAGAPTELLSLEIGAEAWAAFGLALAADLDAGEPGQLHTLTPDDLVVEVLAPAAAATGGRAGLAVRDGAMVWAEAGSDAASGLAQLWLANPGEIHSLTRNAVSDRSPRVGPGGAFVVFSTVVRSELSSATFSVPRVRALVEPAAK